MRRRFAHVFLLASVAMLTGFAPPRPSHSPTPAPRAKPSVAPTLAPHIATPAPQLPAVVVYPFGISGALKPADALRAQHLYVAQMQRDGGLTVITGGADVVRANYGVDARKLGAQYYLSGYMTLLGNSIAVVEQLVSIPSETIVFAQTAQIADFNDAAAQANQVHDAILARESAFNPQLSQTSQTAAATPTPLPQANQGSISNLFRRHAKPTPLPTLPPSLKPGKGIYVVRIAGPISSGDLTAGTQALARDLSASYNVRFASASNTGNVAKEANTICGRHRDNTVVTGAVKMQSVKAGIFHRMEYAFTLQVYTCFGATLATASATNASLNGAIGAAVAAYAAAHPQNE